MDTVFLRSYFRVSTSAGMEYASSQRRYVSDSTADGELAGVQVFELLIKLKDLPHIIFSTQFNLMNYFTPLLKRVRTYNPSRTVRTHNVCDLSHAYSIFRFLCQ